MFDLDGTLFNCEHRLPLIKTKPKNFKAFYSHECVMADTPIPHVVTLCNAILRDGLYEVVFLTGRSDECRHSTVQQIRQTLYQCGNAFEPNSYLYMRKAGDYRKDTIVKSELMDKVIADGFIPMMVFEDRPSVCRMWHARGIHVARLGEHEDF